MMASRKSVYNSYLFFKDFKYQEQFDKFQNSISVKLNSAAWAITIISVVQTVYAYFSYRSNLAGNIYFYLLFLMLATSTSGLLAMHYCRQASRDKLYKGRVSVKTLENIFLIGLSLHATLRMLTRVWIGKCQTENIFEVFGCNPNYDSGSIPTEALYSVALLPLLASMLLRSISWSVVLISWAICFLGSFVALGLNGKLTLIMMWIFFFTYALCSLLVLIEIRLQSITIFMMNSKLFYALKENERMQEAIRKDELRCMIANVAHDLKTVTLNIFVSILSILQSFMTLQPLSAIIQAVDLMRRSILAIGQAQTTDCLNESTVVATKMKSILLITKNIMNINSFMMMNINRCIDYTKASKGISLVAKASSFCLKEALELPHNCMKDLHDSQVMIEPFDISPDICLHIITDKQWLQENVLCLLSNACKYSNHGSVTVQLRLANYTELELSSNSSGEPFNRLIAPESLEKDQIQSDCQQLLVVEVEDHGIGISAEVQPLLFHPFKQAQRLAGGTGLGLYSLAKRIEALKGFYGVRDRRDGQEGSLIWFAIPYKPDDQFADECSSRSAGSLDPEANDVALNILIVDDAVSVSKMCGKMLRELGHKVNTAHNGAVAVEKVVSRWKQHLSLNRSAGDHSFENQANSTINPRYDLVLMDLQMPVMDGLEATRRIRAFENDCNERMNDSFIKTHRTTIIGLSANSDDETIRLSYLSGVDTFVPKPFTTERFTEILVGVLSD